MLEETKCCEFRLFVHLLLHVYHWLCGDWYFGRRQRKSESQRHIPLCPSLPKLSLLASGHCSWGYKLRKLFWSQYYTKTEKKIALFWFHSSTTCPSGESLVTLTWKLFGTPWNLNICSRPQHLSIGRSSLRLLHRFHLFLNVFLVKKKIPQQLQFFFFFWRRTLSVEAFKNLQPKNIFSSPPSFGQRKILLISCWDAAVAG